MGDKVQLPGIIGLTNYRTRFNRPLYGTVPFGARSGTQTARMRQVARNRWRPYNPGPYIPIHPHLASRVATYVGTNTQTRRRRKKQYKKSSCCLYIKGKKICKPKFCPKKRKIYRKRFYW